jgi:hypothetical protein
MQQWLAVIARYASKAKHRRLRLPFFCWCDEVQSYGIYGYDRILWPGQFI